MPLRTPIPDRPATPWMHSFEERPLYWDQPSRWNEGMGEIDVSQITGDITDVFRTVNAGQPGTYTVQNADGSWSQYTQPVGNTSNLPIGSVTGNFQTGVQGNLTSGAGVWILLAVGVGLLIFMRKR
jgi:hypothetical protein